MDDFPGDWVVALTAAGNYIGQAATLNQFGGVIAVKLSPAYQVVYETALGALKRYVRPVLLCAHDIDLELQCVGLMHVHEMHADDRADWFEMIRAVQKGMEVCAVVASLAAMRAQKLELEPSIAAELATVLAKLTKEAELP